MKYKVENVKAIGLFMEATVTILELNNRVTRLVKDFQEGFRLTK